MNQSRMSTHRLTRLLTAAGAAGSLLTATADAHATGVSLPESVKAGRQAVVVVDVPDRAQHCRIRATTSKARAFSRSFAVTGGRMRVSFRVPSRAGTAAWKLVTRCAETRAALSTAPTAAGTVRVRGRRGARPALVTAGSMRITSDGAGRGAGNPFVDGNRKWCTWHAHNKRPDIYEASVNGGAPRWGWDAWVWADRAARFGHLPTGAQPVVGAVAVFSREYYGNRGLGGQYGHVAYVEAVDGGGYTVSEHNGDYNAQPRMRRLPRGQAGVTFIYGGPAGNPNATPTPPTPPATKPPGTTKPPVPPPARTITVDNRVTNGMGMREDATPARLTTQPWTRCGTRGCNIGGTERVSGQTFASAVCQRPGERTTNGHDTSAADDANPLRFESSRYYGVRLANGTFGYVSEVWIAAQDRGGLGLPSC